MASATLDATKAKVEPAREKRKAKLTVRIRIPKHRHGTRRSRYISASTQGMTLAFTGTSIVTQSIGLTRSDPRCTGNPLTCTIVEDLPAGTYTATLSAYDLAPVGGTIPSGAKLLSAAANVPLTVAHGKDNLFNVTLDGVVASLAVSGISNGTAGTSVHQAVTVTAKDADGNVIVGAYSSPVQLSDDDKTTATSIATSGVDSPPAGELTSSDDTATFSYNGLGSTATDTISASATGATAATATFSTTFGALGPSALTGGVPVNAYGAATTVSFTVSEAGWTGAPYNKNVTAALSNGCSTVATVSPASGSTFTATLVSGATTSGSCTLTISDPFGQQLVIPIGYQQFGYTGSAQSFTVPSGVTQTTVVATGAGGAGGSNAGSGGTVTATIPTTPGESLGVYVGGTTSNCNGGYNGGGTCGGNGCNSGGGGASDVRQGGSTISPTDYRVVVAGGGGGGGCDNIAFVIGPEVAGGNGGGQGGGAGGSGGTIDVAPGGTSGGSGNNAGGSGGSGSSCGSTPGCTPGGFGSSGNNGTLGQGGSGGGGGTAGASGAVGYGGAGGGGGYYGGGGGGGAEGTSNCSSTCQSAGGGGGGGGAYAESNATNVLYWASATQTGDGQILITF